MEFVTKLLDVIFQVTCLCAVGVFAGVWYSEVCKTREALDDIRILVGGIKELLDKKMG